MLPDPNIRPARLVVKLQGGIGNQLFQLGLGDFLARDGGGPVAYLADAFANDPYGRSNIVPRLFPDAVLVSQTDISGPQSRLLKEDLLPRQWRGSALRELVENEGISHCILDGYWQDTRYLSGPFIDRLHQALQAQTANAPASRYTLWSQRIAQAANAVAIHVRRYDYKHHGVCRETYYIDCLRWIVERLPGAELFVFSDEPNYTGHFLRHAGLAHHLVNTSDDLLDLLLMAECGVHLISNSTYSWWGAHLANSRLTIYPQPWSALHTPAETFFPSHWVSIADAVSSAIEPVSYAQALAQLSVPAVAPGSQTL
jgi:hypothetical protein